MTSKHKLEGKPSRAKRRAVAALLVGSLAAGSVATAAAQFQISGSLKAADYDAYWQGEVGRLFTMPWETRVGIGTAEPRAALHVNSQTDATLGPEDTGGVMIGRTSHAHQNLVLDGNEIMARRGTEQGTLYLNNDGGSVIIHGAQSVADARVSVDGAGRVQIGRRNDKYADSKLTVDGRVVAEEVVVTVEGFPDYVFDEGYDLASLREVERYIDHNHHLPHMPSAAEVEASGADLADLNKRLLRTVEELTLHAIEQSKKIDAQRRAQQRLERKLSALETARAVSATATE